MNRIPFTKMSGLGNDFIIIDNRNGIVPEIEIPLLAKKLCTPRLSLGGDELMLIENPRAGGDYTMRTINPDGTEVKMCGNASRCVARYAFTRGIAGRSQVIDTLGGPVDVYVDEKEIRVGLQITAGPVLGIELEAAGRKFMVHSVEISGAPHAVVFLDGAFDAPKEQIHQWGAALRNHPYFPEGTNVNFIELEDERTLKQRTFERGVEGETLACGTGATASAVVCGFLGKVQSPVKVRVLGGELSVSFDIQEESSPQKARTISRPFLGGGARFVAEGTLHPEAWQW